MSGQQVAVCSTMCHCMLNHHDKQHQIRANKCSTSSPCKCHAHRPVFQASQKWLLHAARRPLSFKPISHKWLQLGCDSTVCDVLCRPRGSTAPEWACTWTWGSTAPCCHKTQATPCCPSRQVHHAGRVEHLPREVHIGQMEVAVEAPPVLP